MKSLYKFLFLFILIGMLSCSSSEEETPTPRPRTIQDVETDFLNIDLVPGTQDISIEWLNGSTWTFRVIIPPLKSGEVKPLVIGLHGASGGSPTAHQSTACLIEPGFSAIEAFIIHPNGGINLWHEQVNQEMVLLLTLMATKFWPINAERIVVAGYSNGGNGSWFFGETQPDIFSAAIPMASSYNTFSLDGTIRKMDVPMYVIHGENDELFPIDSSRYWVEQTVLAGSVIEFVVAPGLSHNIPCEYVPYLKDAVTWLEDTVWR